MIRFHDPYWLLLLLAIPAVVWNYVRANAGGAVKFSSIANLKRIRPSWSLRLRHVLLVLRCLAIIALAVALARPQRGKEDTRVLTEGIDIVLAVDTSGSMLAEDLARGRNRLDVVKDVVRDFIRKRRNDRIGLVVYGAQAFTQCPLTLDYGVLLQLLDKVRIGTAGEQATAIGDALATALLRLRDSNAKSKIIILLTDGRNNSGRVLPETAAEMASALGIKTYTIGAGSKGLAPMPMQDFFGRMVYQRIQIDIDEDLLQQIAKATNARYFRATDQTSLRAIYDDIDKMEKTKTEVFHYMEYKEQFTRFALLGGAFLLLEIVLANTRYRRLP
ncbi:VWA domain-containing protein [bacterium]|nr:VWA domain-containing protein [bacterium]